DERLRRQAQVRDVVAPLARSRFADLQEELAVLGELQDHVVAERLRAAGLPFLLLAVLSRGGLPAPGRRRAAAVAADPHVAAVVDRDAVVRVGPVVALSRPAPVADEIAGGVELENRRRRRAAL